MIEVVMATFNGARWLPDQLASIRAQSLRADRILVRDDGSSDATCHVLEHAAADGLPIKVLPAHEGHMGAVASFGCLLGQTQANYVLLADQDDLWHPQRVRRMVAAVQEAERSTPARPVLAFSSVKLMDDAGKVLDRDLWRFRRMDSSKMCDFPTCYQTGGIPGCAMLLNRALIDKALPIPRQALMHDFWLHLVAAAFGRVIHVQEAWTYYRLHDSNAVGLLDSSPRALLNWALRRPVASLRHVSAQLRRSQEQAHAFLDRYKDELHPHLAQEVQAYANLDHVPYLRRRITALRHGWRRADMIRTAAFYLVM